jgi:hexulose-6-phosphate isomerase
MKKGIYFGCLPGNLELRERFRLAKDAGFEGVELCSVSSDSEMEAVKALADEFGLETHSIMGSLHWQFPLSSPSSEVRSKCLENMKMAIRHAKMIGADAILLVPAVVTSEVTYEDAYRRSRGEIAKLIEPAEEAGVAIAIENVWNRFLLSPIEFARYIDDFGSPSIRAYFDVGNIMLYGFPHHWIRTLGSRICKVHLKDFRVGPKEFVDILEGDVPWRDVMKALKDVGYDGYLTIEVSYGKPEEVMEASKKLDRIIEMAGR